ncbi:DUF2171 domain-containing protein [Falsiroseomonas ponticola]|uniref:DUF2171 domain-containing protein n=1 Tax=Falsiroseomonas ponticola TaxID=2786951 RepID=UPI001932AE9F|nr:DUF2171 domain-containing protein [Roseomonas ponticola]
MTHHTLHQVQEHMKVVGSDGEEVGTVDHLDGDRIKLTRDQSGQHHFLPGEAVASVGDGQVRLSMPAAQAKRQWQAEPMNPAMNPAMTGATQGQRTMLGAAEAGRGGGQRQEGTGMAQPGKAQPGIAQRQGDKPAVGGEAGDATGGTGMTRDPI